MYGFSNRVDEEGVMGFIVTHLVNAPASGLEAYMRLLKQSGQNLGNLPRVPDPFRPSRRWLCAWSSRADADAFATELREETGLESWGVEETNVMPSNGPFGPVLVQMARQADGLVFALHPLSRTLITEAFPGSVPAATNIFVNTGALEEFQKTRGTLNDLIAQVMPVLTGLSPEQLTDLGYAVLDADDDRAWIDVPAGGIVPV